MTELHVQSRKKQLDDAFDLGARLEKDADEELRAHYAQYLCVRVAGFMERAIVLIYSEHVRRRSAESVRSYAASTIRRSARNLDMRRLVALAASFDPQWGDDLEAFFGVERRDAWNSIVGNRHVIAHGDSVTLTFSRIREYYQRALEVIDFLDKQCL